MTLIRITGASVYPVTVYDVVANGRVDGDDEYDFLTRLIKAATARAEQYTGQIFTSQVWEQVLDAFPGDDITIDLAPITAITSVKYLDSSGDEQTVDVADYSVDIASSTARIVPSNGWPTARDGINSVRVRFAVGAEPPEDVKQAIILMVETWNENRSGAVIGQSVSPAQITIDGLLDLHRRMFV